MLTAVLTSCDSDNPAQERSKRALKSKGEVIIGVGLPLQDKTILFKQGIELAAGEINEAKGVLGRKIKIVWGDDKGSLKDGFSVAKNFIDNKDMVAVIGHVHDYITFRTAFIYEYCGLLMMAPLATHTVLAEDKLTRMFRTIPDNGSFGKALTDFMRKQGYRKMLIYTSDQENLEESGSLADTCEYYAEKNGLVTLDRQVYDMFTDGFQFAKVLKRWKINYDFDVIFFGGSRARVDQGLEFVKEARDMGINAPILSGIGLDRNQFKEQAGPYARNLSVASILDFSAPGKEL
ncbi:MAG: hypothetical protein C0407_10680, partial [Desulfobacca sp.]|nr:hypothetical protein [Desulfobacca sp.]